MITTPYGRTLVRHKSDKGSVLYFNCGGQEKAVFVPDAKYRTRSPFGARGVETPFNSTNYYIYDFRYDQRDEGLNTLSYEAADPIIYNTNTSEQNCDIWMQYADCVTQFGTGVPAVEYARSLTVEGKALDIPNLTTLMRIACEGESIDMLDPTAAEHSFSFRVMNGHCWSSSTSVSYATSHNYTVLLSTKKLSYGLRNSNYYVIPVLEL